MTYTDPFICAERTAGHIAGGGLPHIYPSLPRAHLCSSCGDLITATPDPFGRYRWASPPVIAEAVTWDEL